jgi:hypothetical protein
MNREDFSDELKAITDARRALTSAFHLAKPFDRRKTRRKNNFEQKKRLHDCSLF